MSAPEYFYYALEIGGWRHPFAVMCPRPDAALQSPAQKGRRAAISAQAEVAGAAGAQGPADQGAAWRKDRAPGSRGEVRWWASRSAGLLPARPDVPAKWLICRGELLFEHKPDL